MKSRKNYRFVFGSFLFLIFLLFSGCSSSVTLNVPPLPIRPSLEATSGTVPKYTAVILNLQSNYDGIASEGVEAGFGTQLIQEIRNMGLFKAVYYNNGQFVAPSEMVKVSLQVNKNFERDRALSGLKGALVGGSLFLLSPLIEFNASQTCSTRIRFEKPDFTSKDYTSQVKGEMSAKLFGEDEGLRELPTKVNEACISLLISEIFNDREWLRK